MRVYSQNGGVDKNYSKTLVLICAMPVVKRKNLFDLVFLPHKMAWKRTAFAGRGGLTPPMGHNKPLKIQHFSGIDCAPCDAILYETEDYICSNISNGSLWE